MISMNRIIPPNLPCNVKAILRQSLPEAKKLVEQQIRQLPSIPGVSQSSVRHEVDKAIRQMERELRCP